jgi:hypothetical protein
VFNLGIGEIGVILMVALIFLGPKMLPEIATGLGKIIREIRKATSDIKQDIELDDMIRGPLRELRDAATLPPEELKRRDEAKAARRKAEEEAAETRRREAKAAEEAQRKQREEEAKATIASAVVPPLPVPSEVITAGGTMIANPPPSDELRTLTPLPELHSPAPLLAGPQAPHPPAPPPPAPRAVAPADATVIDLQAQLKASLEAKSTIAGRPVLGPQKPPLYRPREDKKG